MPTNDVRQLLYEPELRYPGGLTITRETAPDYGPDGEAVAGATSSVLLDPVVLHNAGGRDLRRFNIDTTEERLMGYSLVRVYAGGDEGYRDVFTYSGRQWLITHVEDYEVQGGVFLWSAALVETGATE